MALQGSYEICAFACSEEGRVRRNNEDSLLVANLSEGVVLENSGTLKFVSGPKGCLFAVADGMGGVAAGETASRICLQTLYSETFSMARSVMGTDPA